MRRRRPRRPPSTGNVLWLILAAAIALGMVLYLEWRTGSVAVPSQVERTADPDPSATSR